MRAWYAAAALAWTLAGCGGGGGGGGAAPAAPMNGQVIAGSGLTGANVLPVTLDRGIDGSALNAPFVTVTVCAPGGVACVEIDRVLVGSGAVRRAGAQPGGGPAHRQQRRGAQPAFHSSRRRGRRHRRAGARGRDAGQQPARDGHGLHDRLARVLHHDLQGSRLHGEFPGQRLQRDLLLRFVAGAVR
ncbi:MAG: DUF3443 family protein [Comamonadaceae bacterium]|nr:MAG: DUF3443 family protein [Comamonadaceae bacterium]